MATYKPQMTDWVAVAQKEIYKQMAEERNQPQTPGMNRGRFPKREQFDHNLEYLRAVIRWLMGHPIGM